MPIIVSLDCIVLKVDSVSSAGISCEDSTGSHEEDVRLELSDQVTVDTVLSTSVDSSGLSDVIVDSIISEVVAVPSNSVDFDGSRDVIVNSINSVVAALISGSAGSAVSNVAEIYALSDVASISVGAESLTRSILIGVVLNSGVSNVTPCDSTTSKDSAVITTFVLP